MNIHDEIQKSGERLKKQFGNDGYLGVAPIYSKKTLNAFETWHAAEQLALAKKIVEELRPEEIIESIEIDERGDGLLIEQLAEKFGVPISVMANRLLEEAKDSAITEYEAKVEKMMEP